MPKGNRNFVSGWFAPYKKEKECTIDFTGTGVYIIKENDVVVYVGMSKKDVKSTLYRHFQKWTDRRGATRKKKEPYDRVTYKDKDILGFTYQCKVILFSNEHDAFVMESLLIKRLKPRDNKNKAEKKYGIHYDKIEKSKFESEAGF